MPVLCQGDDLVYQTTVAGVQQEVRFGSRQVLSPSHWHNIEVYRLSYLVSISINDLSVTRLLNSSTWINLSSFTFYVAGVPSSLNSAATQSRLMLSSFDGCIRDVRLNGNTMPLSVSSSVARVQWPTSGVSSQCHLFRCRPACTPPYTCNMSSPATCICPMNQDCSTAPPHAPITADTILPWYAWTAVGVGALMLAVCIVVITRKATQNEEAEDTAAKEALRLSPSQKTMKPSLVFRNDEPRPWCVDNVLEYNEEGGEEKRYMNFNIDILLRESNRPRSSLSYSSSSNEVYPQSRTAMTSVNSTANHTACPTPRPTNPNIFLPSQANSHSSTQPGSQATSMTKLNTNDLQDHRNGHPGRYQSSGRSTAQNSHKTSGQGSRKVSPYTSGQSTPHFYHSTPSLAASSQSPHLQLPRMGRIDPGWRRSPQGSSSKGSPNKSPPQFRRQEPQGLEAVAVQAPTARPQQRSRQPQRAVILATSQPDIPQYLRQTMLASHQSTNAAATSDQPRIYTRYEDTDDHDEQLSIAEELCPAESGREIPDPRTLGQDFAHIANLFSYGNPHPATSSTSDGYGTQL